MLVIISDLHLTDNGSSGTIAATAFRIFRERLRNMAYDASWRRNGAYRPIAALDLVLLGDVLDLIRSDLWPCVSPGDAAYVRPWSDPSSAALQNKIAEIVDAILVRNAESLAVIESLNSGQVMTLPPATAEGKVARVGHEPDAPGRVPVEVRIHYMVGNHDWFLHLPGQTYDCIRERIVSAMRLANPTGPFPHDPLESPALATLSEQHRTIFRHGDCYDPLNFEQNRDRSSIGDAIVVDLLGRFAVTVEREMGRELSRECLDGLKQIDSVRPLLIVPVWVDGLLRRTCPDQRMAGAVKEIWDEMVDQFLAIDYVRRCGPYLPPHTLDHIELALKISRGLSLHSLSRISSWFRDKVPGGNRPSYQDALGESAYKNRTARAVVYAHTHSHEIVPLDVSYSSQGVLNQVYLNSGTWRLVHEQARQNERSEAFIDSSVMTYLGFYKDDERGGRPFEAWSGTLSPPQT